MHAINHDEQVAALNSLGEMSGYLNQQEVDDMVLKTVISIHHNAAAKEDPEVSQSTDIVWTTSKR